MRNVEILIIGGGPAGLAAAIGAYEAGARDILILEREATLGGILKQCIHNGFGLHTFKEELTGPEYAQRFIDEVHARGIAYLCDTMVLSITKDKRVVCVSRAQGMLHLQAKAVILAMGCRERPRGSLATPGTRPAGVYTAGTAQKMVNLKGMLPGNTCVILGSGDIGLIMARRMTFVGAKVLACVELMPYSAGLKRNIVQCLDDYDIPLLLSHTVVEIHGRERLEGVTIARVDEKLRPIPDTKQYLACDTLLLSVGLIPENELAAMAGVELAPSTSGAVVDERLESNVPGIFACGNALHVHDLVDFVSAEAKKAGENAAAYARGAREENARKLPVRMGMGVGGVVPQYVTAGAKGPVNLMFRPRAVFKEARIVVDIGGEDVLVRKTRIMAPGEMVSLTLTPEMLENTARAQSVDVRIETEEV